MANPGDHIGANGIYVTLRPTMLGKWTKFSSQYDRRKR